MRKKLKAWFTKKPGIHANKAAKQEQMKYAVLLLAIAGVSAGFYSYSSSPQKKPVAASDATHFDGVFDAAFNQGSDEALIEKQQQQIDKLTDLVTTHAEQAKTPSNATDTNETKTMLLSMQEKLTHLEEENKKRTNNCKSHSSAPNKQTLRFAHQVAPKWRPSV